MVFSMSLLQPIWIAEYQPIHPSMYGSVYQAILSQDKVICIPVIQHFPFTEGQRPENTYEISAALLLLLQCYLFLSVSFLQVQSGESLN